MELGAEFIHGDVNPIVELCEEEGWSRRHLFTWSHGDGGPAEAPAPDGGMGYYYLGREKKLLRFDDPDPDFAACNEALWRLPETEAVEADADPRSLRQYLVDEGVPERMLGMACAGYGNTAGGTSDSVPASAAMRLERCWRGDGTELDPDFRMEHSFGVLIEHLSKGLTVKTSAPVASIVAPPSPSALLSVHLKSGEVLQARKAVVTVPLPVLKSGDIAFSPPLPCRKLAAIDSMSFANGVKVVLKFKSRPWPSHCHGVVCADSFVPEMWMNNTGVGVGGLITGTLASYPPSALGYHLHLEREECEGGDDDPTSAGASRLDPFHSASLLSNTGGLIDAKIPRHPFSTSTLSGSEEDARTLEESADASVPRSASPPVVCGAFTRSPLGNDPPPLSSAALPQPLTGGSNVALEERGVVEAEDATETPGVSYLVTGFIMGSRADAMLSQNSQPATIARFLSQMDTMFGGTATHPSLTPASDAYLEGFVHNWGKEAYIRGAYSTPTPQDQPGAAGVLREPCMDNRLFFAGEATAGSVDGTMRHLPVNRVNYASPIVLHGAMNSGALAAGEVASSLGVKGEGSLTEGGFFSPTYKFKDEFEGKGGLLVWRQAAANPPSPCLKSVGRDPEQGLEGGDIIDRPSTQPSSPRLSALAVRRGLLATRSLPHLMLEGSSYFHLSLYKAQG